MEQVILAIVTGLPATIMAVATLISVQRGRQENTDQHAETKQRLDVAISALPDPPK